MRVVVERKRVSLLLSDAEEFILTEVYGPYSDKEASDVYDALENEKGGAGFVFDIKELKKIGV